MMTYHNEKQMARKVSRLNWELLCAQSMHRPDLEEHTRDHIIDLYTQYEAWNVHRRPHLFLKWRAVNEEDHAKLIQHSPQYA